MTWCLSLLVYKLSIMTIITWLLYSRECANTDGRKQHNDTHPWRPWYVRWPITSHTDSVGDVNNIKKYIINF